MSESYFKKTPDELRRIMDTSPPDTPAYIKARDALLSRGEPLKAYVYQPYPRVWYHWKFGTKTVQSEDEEKVLLRDKGWVDSPAKVWKPSPSIPSNFEAGRTYVRNSRRRSPGARQGLGR
jgi:hypothetical protein